MRTGMITRCFSSINYSKIKTINSLSFSTSKGRIFSQKFHSYSKSNNIANCNIANIFSNKPLISFKLSPLTPIHLRFYSTSTTPNTPTPAPISPPSLVNKKQFSFNEIFFMLKKGYFQLIEDFKKYFQIRKKTNRDWNDFHFMERHELNMKKIISLTLTILLFSTVPFSMFALPLILICFFSSIPSVFLMPYIKVSFILFLIF